MLNIGIPDKMNLVKLIRKNSAKRKSVKQQIQFYHGEQDQIDLISYSGLEENASYLRLGDKFIRTLFISGFPQNASTGWLSMLVNFNY
jgi:hypothetical protein